METETNGPTIHHDGKTVVGCSFADCEWTESFSQTGGGASRAMEARRAHVAEAHPGPTPDAASPSATLDDYVVGVRYMLKMVDQRGEYLEATVSRVGLHDLTITDVTYDERPAHFLARTQIVARAAILWARRVEHQPPQPAAEP